MITDSQNKLSSKKVHFDSFVSRIEKMILTGALKPRERLVEAALAEMLGVSRYLVRDAFKILEAKGLVTVIPFRGAIVSELETSDVEEIFAIRVALEQLALKKVADNVTDADIKVLRSMVGDIESSYNADDITALSVADTSFHDYVFQLSKNKTLCRTISDFRNRSHVVRYTAWSSPDVLVQLMKEHRLIVDAIEAKNVAEIYSLSEAHVTHVKNAYLQRMKVENAFIAGMNEE